MNLKRTLVLCLISAGIGGYLVKQYLPTETIKTEVQEKEKIVTIIKKIVAPDGTTTEETTKTEDRVTDTDVVAVLAPPPPNWHISAQYMPDAIPAYGVQIERRILGPVFVGVGANTRKELNISVGFEF